jgi:DNA-binding GntR family transcriptional regulator
MPVKNKRISPGTETTRITVGKAADINLNDIAYTRIKEDIISCALQPGEDISEGVLVARYSLGKAPIRHALMRLRQEGLITSRGRQGAVVSAIMLRDVQEIFQLRLVLEVTAVRLAAGQVDKARIRELNQAVHAGYTPGNKASEATYLRANRDFHQYVAESSGNRRLAALVVNLMEQHERIVHLGLALQNREREFLHSHDDLVKALIEGDSVGAAQLTETALRGGQSKVLNALADSVNQISVTGLDLSPK